MNVRASTRRTVTVVVAAMLATLLASTGAAWAYWTATANLTASIKLSDVRVALGGTSGLTTTFANEALVSTTSFTVSNPGSETGAVTLRVVPGTASSLRGTLRLELWRQAGGSCATTSGTVTTGTWATISAPVGNLAAGTTQTWCARTTATSREAIAHVSGTQSATTSLVASMSVSGGAVTDTAAVTHSTRLVYPAANVTSLLPANASAWFTIQRGQATTRCLDVAYSGGTGAAVLGYGCLTSPNQRWRIAAVAGGAPGRVTFQPMHGSGLPTRIAVNGTNVQVSTASDVASQRWFYQAVSATTFQLVDETGGRCLTTGVEEYDPSTVVACSDALRSRQVFGATRHPLAMTVSGDQVRFSFGTVPGGAAVSAGWEDLRLQVSSGGTWTDVVGTSRDDVSITAPRAALTTGTNIAYRIVRTAGGTTYVLYDGIQITRSGTTVTIVRGNG
ncbi:RICIN domain-containing protein [Flavimobilis sp. GY10621]|uniref:RICIN domain-containing protein n=1 Tax=Flavimobilis rhizosphaerae TaxID=2775421 RepID=A0ABR9DTM2_9MICO|nr:RICIN domain-containing protein [Flavimobilis rhizosphaerae]MBD9699340.1 RICIN domain-containing protein [Flavimobilis rhizosphaerae]